MHDYVDTYDKDERPSLPLIVTSKPFKASVTSLFATSSIVVNSRPGSLTASLRVFILASRVELEYWSDKRGQVRDRICLPANAITLFKELMGDMTGNKAGNTSNLKILRMECKVLSGKILTSTSFPDMYG